MSSGICWTILFAHIYTLKWSSLVRPTKTVEWRHGGLLIAAQKRGIIYFVCLMVFTSTTFPDALCIVWVLTLIWGSRASHGSACNNEIASAGYQDAFLSILNQSRSAIRITWLEIPVKNDRIQNTSHFLITWFEMWQVTQIASDMNS